MLVLTEITCCDTHTTINPEKAHGP